MLKQGLSQNVEPPNPMVFPMFFPSQEFYRRQAHKVLLAPGTWVSFPSRPPFEWYFPAMFDEG
jgi:hypothetical protein